MSVIRVRHAVADDSAEIFRWRNDPQTRQMSIVTDPVPWDRHVAWYQDALRRSERFLYVGESNEGVAIGVCRFDLREISGEAEVSINLSPAARGRGLSSQLLEESIRAFRLDRGNAVSLVATVKSHNVASIRCFERVGFMKESEKAECIYFRLEEKNEGS